MSWPLRGSDLRILTFSALPVVSAGCANFDCCSPRFGAESLGAFPRLSTTGQDPTTRASSCSFRPKLRPPPSNTEPRRSPPALPFLACSDPSAIRLEAQITCECYHCVACGPHNVFRERRRRFSLDRSAFRRQSNRQPPGPHRAAPGGAEHSTGSVGLTSRRSRVEFHQGGDCSRQGWDYISQTSTPPSRGQRLVFFPTLHPHSLHFANLAIPSRPVIECEHEQPDG